MPHEYTLTRTIEFAETDMAGIVHFANFYRMMENTEHAFLRSLGFSVHGEVDGTRLGFPRVAASCEFFKPLRFEEPVAIQLIVLELRNRAIRYGFHFWKNADAEREEAARGEVTVVCASVAAGKLTAVPLPAVFRERMQAAPPELTEVFSKAAAKQT